jgi:hypothetical protein
MWVSNSMANQQHEQIAIAIRVGTSTGLQFYRQRHGLLKQSE